MQDFMQDYFGPLGQEYCLYFYFLSIIFYILFIMSLIGVAGGIYMNYKKLNTMFVLNSSLLILNTLLAYFVNRLLNTMCMNSIPNNQ